MGLKIDITSGGIIRWLYHGASKMKAWGIIACLTAIATAYSVIANENVGGGKPNFVFIVVDDMGWADLGCYGQDAYETPNIDRLAATGIRFTQAYSGCTVCAPARSTLMTGLHMGHTQVRGNTGGIPLPDSAVTVAEVLREEGYICGGFGKWGLGDLNTSGVPEKQGFSRFFGYYHQIHAHYYFPEYLIDTGKKVFLKENEGFYEDEGGRSGGISTDTGDYKFSHYLVFERMLEFIRSNKDRPFFCYAPWTPPHSRYEIPADDPAWREVENKPWPLQARTHAAFNIMVDRQVGRVLRLLEELGLSGETYVFFTSDNGASQRFERTLDSSGPLTGFKRSMHEGGIRVPFIVNAPEFIDGGRVSELPVYFPDVMPTLAALAGAEKNLPEHLDGISLVPTLHGDEAKQKRHEFMYWEWPAYNWGRREYTGKMMQAVRHGDWKALRHDNSEPWRLYDLAKDIAEETNLADKYPEVVTEVDEWVTANRTEPVEQVEPEQPAGRSYR